MAEPIDWRELGAGSPFLAALPASARAAARLRDLAAGEPLFHRGDRPRAMYVVLSGEMRLIRHSRGGGELVLQRSRGGPFAEASLDQPAYHCDAVAAAATRLLAIDRAAFRAALSDPAFRDRWMAHLARELRRVRAQNERISLRSAPGRIVHYLESECDDGCLTLRQSRKDWASELGLTHEALYRALARMARQGTLRIDGATIRLVPADSSDIVSDGIDAAL